MVKTKPKLKRKNINKVTLNGGDGRKCVISGTKDGPFNITFSINDQEYVKPHIRKTFKQARALAMKLIGQAPAEGK